MTAKRIGRREWLQTLGAASLLVGSEAGAAATSPWKAGVAKRDITPTESIWMAGYGNRTRPSEGVLQKIYVKCVALKWADGDVSSIITSDLLGFPRDVADAIARGCESQHGIQRERLILNSSHTHSGPVIGRMLKPAYPVFTNQQEEVIARYTRELVSKVVAAVGEAVSALQPATISFGQGLAGFGVNRRRVRLRNLPGPVDQDVPVIAVRDDSGKLRAVLFGYACHNTSLGNYQINGDWAGFAQQELETRYPDAIAQFVQGCGADVNPLPRYQGNDSTLSPYSVELPRMYGKILAAAVDITLHDSMKPVSGPLSAGFRRVDLPFHDPPDRAELTQRMADKSAGNASVRRHAEYMLSIIEREGKLPDRYPYPVQVWQFGKDLNLVALGGEVVVDYSLRLKAQHGWDTTWVAGYCNDVFAYIPSRRVLNEGGYEGGGAMIAYGQPGPFGSAVEEIIVEQVNDLMRKTRNP
jgi:neutral ceramidase